MNWAWANALDQIWRSPAFPMWLTLVAAGFFGVIGIITLMRAEKSVANGALTVITLLAIGVAVAATTRSFGLVTPSGSDDSQSAVSEMAVMPGLACLDDLAGEVVLAACEKAVFGSPESVAAAVAYAARQITRLTRFGDVAAADRNMTPELEALRRAVERDRYGLMAEVLAVRDHCTPADCAAFKSLSDHHRIAANLDERVYDGMVVRYSAVWNAPPALAAAPAAALIPGVPTGKPTNAEFPSAASTPPVSIMTVEPGATASASRSSVPAASAPTPAARPASAASPTQTAAKKQTAPKPAPARALVPVQIVPAAPAGSSNEQ
ncbi:MAG TPA: hypothetical protein VKT76_08285 [Bradyrhizobium sp.]|nr:hypothetical protein [Bradyrhizobium sp.]